MPLGLQPICSVCEAKESQMWSKSIDGSIQCHDCWNQLNNNINDNQQNGSHSNDNKEVLNSNNSIETDNNEINNNIKGNTTGIEFE